MSHDSEVEIDLLIVGAGLTGLTVAHALQTLAPGVTVQILEARKRSGGRILTLDREEAGYGFDLGPTWVWPGHEHVLGLADELGVERYAQFEAGDGVFDRGPGMVQRFSPPPNPMESRRLVGGVGALIDALHTRLPDEVVRYGRVVHGITDLSHGLRVHARGPNGDEVYLAAQIVLTLPPRLLVNAIAFDPGLPQDVTQMMAETQTWMGQAMKAVLVYDRPFWREDGLSGLGVSYRGPVAQFHDASPPDGRLGALFGWLGNHSPGRALSPEERQNAVIAQAVAMFGPEAAHVRHYAEHNWAQDSFTTHPGQALASEQEHPRYGHPLFQRPYMQGRLHLAGTETSPVNGGYLDGAVYSGRQMAQRVAQAASVKVE